LTHDANLFRVHFDPLDQRAEVIATVAAALGPHAPSGLAGEGHEHLRRDARPKPIKRALGPLCVGAGLIADSLQLGHTLPQHWIGYVSDSVFDGAVDPRPWSALSFPPW
jgi:hypothetical protein